MSRSHSVSSYDSGSSYYSSRSRSTSDSSSYGTRRDSGSYSGSYTDSYGRSRSSGATDGTSDPYGTSYGHRSSGSSSSSDPYGTSYGHRSSGSSSSSDPYGTSYGHRSSGSQTYRPVPPAVSTGSSSSTYVTPGGTTVYRDPSGRVHYPSRSNVVDGHVSNSGKSYVVDHQDGIREITNYQTGRVTYSRIPAGQIDSRYVAPSNAPTRTYRRTNVDVTSITINENNYYLRDTGSYYRREPVFYSGYRWQPPVFSPVLFAAGMTLAALDAVYRPQMPRDYVSNMEGSNYYTSQFESAGIYSSYDLVNAGRTPEDRQQLAAYTGIPYSEVRKAVGQADLMRVDGIGPRNSRLLVDAGIESMQDLARYTWDPESLYEQLRYSSYWDDQNAPSLGQVESWIDQARNLPVAIYDDPQY